MAWVGHSAITILTIKTKLMAFIFTILLNLDASYFFSLLCLSTLNFSVALSRSPPYFLSVIFFILLFGRHYFSLPPTTKGLTLPPVVVVESIKGSLRVNKLSLLYSEKALI